MASPDNKEPGLLYYFRKVDKRVSEMLDELQTALVGSGAVEVPLPPN